VKSLGLYYRLSGELLPLFKRLGSPFLPKNNRFLHRVEKVRVVQQESEGAPVSISNAKEVETRLDASESTSSVEPQ
jgi:hypothetical protein